MCSDGGDYTESSEYEQELINMSEKMFADYQENYAPLADDIIEQVQGYRSEGYKQHSKDQGVNAARMQNSGTVTAGAGKNPTSGGYMQASQNAQNQTGFAGGMGAMSGLQTTEDQYMSGMLGMTQVGRGQQADALQGISQLAGIQAGQNMAELASKQYVSDQKLGAAGSIAGMGGAYGYNKGWFGNNSKT